jgi:sugar lactone lactonase YvrE
MAAFERDGRAYLVIADVGDNRHRRSQYDLYLVTEPDLSAEPKPKQAAVAGRIRFTYEDGRHNCEGLAVSPDGSTAWLVVKTMGLIANVYRMDLDWDAAEPLTARRVGQVETPTVTGLDLSPDGRRMFVLSYGDGYEYRRGEEETWDRALKRSPRAVALPRREQGEAAAYGLDGRTLYLTSEGRPMPLWILSR